MSWGAADRHSMVSRSKDMIVLLCSPQVPCTVWDATVYEGCQVVRKHPKED